MANARRRAILRLTPQLLGEFLRNGERHFSVEGGVSKNARFIGAWFNHRRKCFDVVFESVAFDLVADGAKMPILPPPLIRTIHK